MKNQLIAFAISFILLSNGGISQVTEKNFWGSVQRIDFSDDELPPNLYSMFTGDKKASFLQYCLPANYSKEKNYPLLVYVPGFHGHPGGNIRNAIGGLTIIRSWFLTDSSSPSVKISFSAYSWGIIG